MINLYLGDCMEAMREMKENQYDLAIVDPPYGIGAERGTNRASRAKFANKEYGWDSQSPPPEYYQALFSVALNQIIWGANHFIEDIPNANSKHWIVWDKKNPDRCFADCEFAWCSNMDNARIAPMKRVQELNRMDGGKIHPTQKPVKLYEWLLMNYAKPGEKILDTHGGSMSIALAVHNVNEREGMNLSLDLWEIDPEYYKAGVDRYESHIKQTTIFTL